MRYLEWTYDPDPSDTWTLTEYVFVLRDEAASAPCTRRIARACSPRATWLRAARARPASATAEAILEQTTEDREPREHVQGVPVSSSGSETASSAAISTLRSTLDSART